jgi:hypothetical protein
MPAGLTQREAERRVAARPAAPQRSSRSYNSIVVANVFTVFNLILLVFGVVTLVFAKPQDALFLAILVANSVIGIAQEVRAKRTLDRLAALVAPTATVVRDGKPRRVRVPSVVEGDTVLLEPGDQVVGDGRLQRSDGLALDESILTGETDPAPRAVGEEVRSGSFAAEGAGAYVVTAVGDDSYAARLAGEAREFRHPLSPLDCRSTGCCSVLVGVLVALGVALVWTLWRRRITSPWKRPSPPSRARPEGLILLTSVIRSRRRGARRGALAQHSMRSSRSRPSTPSVSTRRARYGRASRRAARRRARWTGASSRARCARAANTAKLQRDRRGDRRPCAQPSRRRRGRCRSPRTGAGRSGWADDIRTRCAGAFHGRTPGDRRARGTRRPPRRRLGTAGSPDRTQPRGLVRFGTP